MVIHTAGPLPWHGATEWRSSFWYCAAAGAERLRLAAKAAVMAKVRFVIASFKSLVGQPHAVRTGLPDKSMFRPRQWPWATEQRLKRVASLRQVPAVRRTCGFLPATGGKAPCHCL
jgi:hypothetical protein